MSHCVVLKLIEADLVDSAYQKYVELVETFHDQQLIDILKTLNKLLYNAKKDGIRCISSLDNIFKLADACCSRISINWCCTRYIFMQCLYHIKSYFLYQHEYTLGMKLCRFLFKLKKDLNITKWDEKEELVVSNTCYNFITYVNNNSQEIRKNEHLNDLTSFVTQLTALSNTINLSSQLRLILSIFRTLSKDKIAFIKYGCFCISELSNSLSHSLERKTSHVLLNEKCFSNFITFLDNFLIMLDQKMIIEKGKDFINLLKLAKCSTPKSHIILLEGIQHSLAILINCDSPELCDNINKITDCLKADINVIEVLVLISHLVYTARSKLAQSSYVEKQTLLYFYQDLLLKFYQYANTGSSRLTYEYINNINGCLTVISGLNEMEPLKEAVSVGELCFNQLTKLLDEKLISTKHSLNAVNNYLIALSNYKKRGLHKETINLSKLLLKYLNNTDIEWWLNSELKMRYISSVFTTLVHAQCDVGQLNEAQISLAAFFVIHRSHCLENIIKLWTDIKLRHSEDISTLYGTLCKYETEIIAEWADFNLNDVDAANLLINEIVRYSKHRKLFPSAFAVYQMALEEEHAIDEITLSAILISISEVINTIKPDEYLEGENSIKKRLSSLEETLIEKKNRVSPAEKWKLDFTLGNILYQQTRFAILDLQKKCQEECSVLDTGALKDKKDFIPAITSLKGSCIEVFFDNFERCAGYWKSSMDRIEKNIITVQGLKYIKSVGYIYRLYNYKEKEWDAWGLLYSVATKLCQPKYRVIAVAEMLGISNNIDSSLMNDMITLIQEENTEVNCKSYVYQLFYVNLAKHQLFKGEINESVATLEKLNALPIKNNLLVYAQQQILITQINSSKPNLSIDNLEPTLFPVSKIYENLLYIFKNKKWNSFPELCVLQWLMIYAANFLGKNYADLQLVRFTRNFSGNQYRNAVSLGLPLWSCELITSLIRLYIDCSKVNTCENYLQSLERILELKDFVFKFYFLSTHRNESSDLPSEFGRNTLRFQADFLSHSDDCHCYFCRTLNYPIQTLNYITLRILLLELTGTIPLDVVKTLLEMGDKVVDFISNKLKQSKYNLINDFHECKVRFLMASCKCAINSKDFSSANKLSNLLLTELQTMINPNMLLNCHAQDLRNQIKWKNQSIDLNYGKVNEVKKKRREKENFEKFKNVKTPLAGQRPVLPSVGKNLFITNIGNTPITPKKFKKKLKFNEKDEGQGFVKKEGDLPFIDVDENFYEKELDNLITPTVKGKRQSDEGKKALAAITPTNNESNVVDLFTNDKTPVLFDHDVIEINTNGKENSTKRKQMRKELDSLDIPLKRLGRRLFEKDESEDSVSTPIEKKIFEGKSKDVEESVKKSVKTYGRRINIPKTVSHRPQRQLIPVDPFSTPSLNPRHCIPIYCDDGDKQVNYNCVTTTLKRTTRSAAAGRAKTASTTTGKKRVGKKLFCDEPNEKDKDKLDQVQDIQEDSPVLKRKEKWKTRRVLFNGSISDSDEDTNDQITIKNANKSANCKNKEIVENKKKEEVDVIVIDSDVSIIETTPPKRTKKKTITLTPKGLATNLERLTLTTPRVTRSRRRLLN